MSESTTIHTDLRKMIKNDTKRIKSLGNKLTFCKTVIDRLKESTEEQEKTKIFKELEKNMACVICHQIIVKCTVIECGHAFCNLCICKWSDINSSCPVCRGQLKEVVFSRPIDRAINYAHRLIGGTIFKNRKTNIKQYSYKEVDFPRTLIGQIRIIFPANRTINDDNEAENNDDSEARGNEPNGSEVSGENEAENNRMNEDEDDEDSESSDDDAEDNRNDEIDESEVIVISVNEENEVIEFSDNEDM